MKFELTQIPTLLPQIIEILNFNELHSFTGLIEHITEAICLKFEEKADGIVDRTFEGKSEVASPADGYKNNTKANSINY